MEMWELVKRLLAGANGANSTYLPEMIARRYKTELEKSGQKLEFSDEVLNEAAEDLVNQLKEQGLLQDAGQVRPGLGNVAAMERTDFGDELLQTLSVKQYLEFFENMQAQVDAGYIRQLIYQLNS